LALLLVLFWKRDKNEEQGPVALVNSKITKEFNKKISTTITFTNAVYQLKLIMLYPFPIIIVSPAHRDRYVA